MGATLITLAFIAVMVWSARLQWKAIKEAEWREAQERAKIETIQRQMNEISKKVNLDDISRDLDSGTF